MLKTVCVSAETSEADISKEVVNMSQYLVEVSMSQDACYEQMSQDDDWCQLSQMVEDDKDGICNMPMSKVREEQASRVTTWRSKEQSSRSKIRHP